MSFIKMIRNLVTRSGSSARRRPHHRSPVSSRPFLEPLEGRTLLSANFAWAISPAETIAPAKDHTYAVAADAAGNAYVAGYFMEDGSGSDFDPGPGVSNLYSAGDKDIYVAKYSPTGDVIWAVNMGGAQEDRARGIALDNAGHVYVVGNYFGPADFNLGNSLQGNGNSVFLAKLDANDGQTIWARGELATASQFLSYAVAVDSSDMIYIAGPNIGSTTSFLTQIEPTAGNTIWQRQLSGNVHDIDVSNSAVLVGGEFRGTADFDPGAGSYSLFSGGAVGQPAYAGYILSLASSSGTFQWASHFEGTKGSNNRVNTLTVDNSGNVFAGGSFSGKVDFDPRLGRKETLNLPNAGGVDAFVSKLSSSGNLVWAKSLGGSGGDSVNAISLDVGGNIYLAGSFSGTADFNPAAGAFNLTSAGSLDIFVVQLDSTGTFQWASHAGGTGDDLGEAIAVDPLGSVYVAGSFNQDPSSSLNYLADFDRLAVHLDGSDILGASEISGYLWKLDQV